MKISLTVGYAVAALLQLANHRVDSPLSTAAIASAADMPERYLLQIMKALKDAGLVVATRGVNGGYNLAKPIGRISLGEVYEAIEGPFISPPLRTHGLTTASQRLIETTLADIAAAERQRLGGFSLNALKSGK